MGAFDPLLGAFMIGTLLNLWLFGINWWVSPSCLLTAPGRRGRRAGRGCAAGVSCKCDRLTMFVI